MPLNNFPLSAQVGRVPSSIVPLSVDEERRFERIMDRAVMIDVHQHPFVLPESMDRFIEFLRAANWFEWGYQAAIAGGWSAVTTSNFFTALYKVSDMSFVEYDDIAAEVGGMLADMAAQDDVVRVGNADEILAARQQGKVGFMRALEHLPIGNHIERVNALFGNNFPHRSL